LEVLLVDAQYLTRLAIKGIVQERPGYQVIEKETPREVDQYLSDQNPDLIIADIDAFQQKEISSLIDRAKNKILLISNNKNPVKIKKWLDTGVKCMLTKECSREEIMLAMDSVVKGRKFYCNNVLDIITRQTPNVNNEQLRLKLTRREYEILKLIARGYTSTQIAEKLVLSVHTINSHRKNILKKLNLKSPTQLVAYVHSIGLIR
jgi:two-component system response regulator NreC